MAKYHSTKFRGVRYREHLTRKHGILPDRYFYIRYQVDGKRKEEGLGWSSADKMTASKAALILAELKEAARTGQGETRLSEKRKKARVKKERAEQEELQRVKEQIAFSDFFEQRYYPAVSQNRTRWTNSREDSLHRLWIGPVIGNKPFKDIAPVHLERIKKNMTDASLSPRSVHYALSVVRQVFNYAAKVGFYTGANPVKSVSKPKYDNRRQRFLSQDEAGRLLVQLKATNRDTYRMALISLHCGLRAGEIFSLSWGDVDLQHGLINLRDTKSGRNHTVHMTGAVRSLFAGMEHGKNNDFLFTGQKGRKLLEIPSVFKTAVKACGLNNGVTDRRQRATFHTIRHTFASWSVMAGVDLYVLQKILGHSTIGMTERYAHLAPDKFKAAAQVFEQSIIEPGDANKRQVIA